MGQGDCILIVCPNGKLVMIDCGSAKGIGSKANKDLLLDVCTNVRKFTSKNKSKIDILILTHKDKDHYNQVYEIFQSRTITETNGSVSNLSRVNIGHVYFSSPARPSNNYALTQFLEGNTGNYIIGHTFKTKTVNQVFINATEQKMLTYEKDSNFLLSSETTTPINGFKLKLLSGTTAGKEKWSVSIIAGQVPETDSNSDDITNALSLVTLLQIGTSKALFLGDATKATESFLIRMHSKLIKDIDFVHIPHHGSRTSSGPVFVKLVNPKGAEVTHETFETGNKLPKEEVLARWLKTLITSGSVEKHIIDYWEQFTDTKYDEILADWKAKKYQINGGPNGWYLLKPNNYRNNFVFIYKTRLTYWGLYRKQTNLNLWATGGTGYVQWTLPLD